MPIPVYYLYRPRTVQLLPSPPEIRRHPPFASSMEVPGNSRQPHSNSLFPSWVGEAKSAIEDAIRATVSHPDYTKDPRTHTLTFMKAVQQMADTSLGLHITDEFLLPWAFQRIHTYFQEGGGLTEPLPRATAAKGPNVRPPRATTAKTPNARSPRTTAAKAPKERRRRASTRLLRRTRRRYRRINSLKVRPSCIQKYPRNLLEAWPHLRSTKNSADSNTESGPWRTSRAITLYVLPSPTGAPALNRFYAFRTRSFLRNALYRSVVTYQKSIRVADCGDLTPYTALQEDRITATPIRSMLNHFLVVAHECVNHFGGKFLARPARSPHRDKFERSRGKGLAFCNFENPVLSVGFSSLHDLGNAIGLSEADKLSILVRGRPRRTKRHPSYILCASLLKGRSARVGAEKRCVYFHNIAPFTHYNSESFCHHLPVSDWFKGHWKTDFELVPSSDGPICSHWRHSAEQIDHISNAFRIEWRYNNTPRGDRLIDYSGCITISIPIVNIRGPDTIPLLARTREHLANNIQVPNHRQ